MQPTFDRVLLERYEETKETTESGLIVIPEEAQLKERSQFAIVRSVGPDVQDRTLRPGVGVLVGKYAGTELVDNTFEITNFLVVRDREILAVLEESDLERFGHVQVN